MDSKKTFGLLIMAIMVVGMTVPFITQNATATTYTVTPALPFNLLVPQPNTLRQSWAALVLSNLQSIGVSASELITDWGTIYARALIPSTSVVGKNYTAGGFDSLFVGYALGASPNPYSLFDSTQFAPTSSNYYLYNDSINDAMLSNITHTTAPNHSALPTLLQWQAYIYNQLPTVAIEYGDLANAYSAGSNPSGVVVNGSLFPAYQYPLWPSIERWQYYGNGVTGENTSITIAQTGPAEPEYGGSSLNPLYTSSYYDLTVYGPIYGEGPGFGLLGLYGGDQAQPFGYFPYMATSMPIVHENYHIGSFTNYTFYIRPNIYFQDMEPLDARDVVWTNRYEMTPAAGYIGEAYTATILGSNSDVYWQGEPGITGANSDSSLMHESDGLNVPNVVHFNLTAPWAFFDNDVGLSTILPSSILINSSSYSTIDYANWPAYADSQAAALGELSSTSFSTGLSNVTYSYYAKNGTLYKNVWGPFGAGPYRYMGTDLATSTSWLQKWSGYFNWATLNAAGFPGITNYYVVNIVESTAAVAALKAGTVEVLDAQYQLQEDLSILDPAWSAYKVFPAYDVQEWGFNMQSPIWGTGTETPLGLQNPARAAEAAWDVRHAFELCVPKEAIIQSLLGGNAMPGVANCICPIHSYNGQPCFIGYATASYGPTQGYNQTVSYTFRNYTESDALTLAEQYLREAGYSVVPVTPPSFWDSYGLLLAVVELAVIVVLAGFYLYRPRGGKA